MLREVVRGRDGACEEGCLVVEREILQIAEG